MAHAPDVPELAPDLAAAFVHRVGHQAPARDLLRGVDSGGAVVAVALGADRRRLAEQDLRAVRTRTLRVVLGHHRGGDVAGHLGAGTGERCEVEGHVVPNRER